MNSIPVQSSMMSCVGYDPESQVLQVTFRGSSTYEFFSVPERVFKALMSSSSKGRFFRASIKGAYQSAKM